ncbi:MAG: CARDB domain-containing protein, partial [Candidatus Micrarchaeia archaeon]
MCCGVDECPDSPMSCVFQSVPDLGQCCANGQSGCQNTAFFCSSITDSDCCSKIPGCSFDYCSGDCKGTPTSNHNKCRGYDNNKSACDLLGDCEWQAAAGTADYTPTLEVPSDVNVGDTFQATIKTTNIGSSTPSKSSTTNLSWGPGTLDWKSRVVPPLAPGVIDAWVWSISCPAVATDLAINVTVDSRNNISESNEGNNFISKTVHCGGNVLCPLSHDIGSCCAFGSSSGNCLDGPVAECGEIDAGACCEAIGCYPAHNGFTCDGQSPFGGDHCNSYHNNKTVCTKVGCMWMPSGVDYVPALEVPARVELGDVFNVIINTTNAGDTDASSGSLTYVSGALSLGVSVSPLKSGQSNITVRSVTCPLVDASRFFSMEVDENKNIVEFNETNNIISKVVYCGCSASQRCTHDSDCCSAMVCGSPEAIPDKRCCIPTGSNRSCTFASDCCEGICERHVCKPAACPFTPTIPTYVDITPDPANGVISVSLFNQSMETYEKSPIGNGLIFIVNMSDKENMKIYYDVTGSNGHMPFPYDPNVSGCIDYWFIFCPLGNAIWNLTEREMCLNSTKLNYDMFIKNNPARFSEGEPATPIESHDFILSHNELYLCNKVPSDYARLCWPLMLILGLLLGANFAAGKNPFHSFDFSSPRMGRGRQYSMRVQNKSFDYLSYIMGAVTAVSSAKGAMKKKDGKTKEPKEKKPEKEHKTAVGKFIHKVGETVKKTVNKLTGKDKKDGGEKGDSGKSPASGGAGKASEGGADARTSPGRMTPLSGGVGKVNLVERSSGPVVLGKRTAAGKALRVAAKVGMFFSGTPDAGFG